MPDFEMHDTDPCPMPSMLQTTVNRPIAPTVVRVAASVNKQRTIYLRDHALVLAESVDCFTGSPLLG